jgi:hypothetical protein
MAMSLDQARELCNKAEFPLAEASFPPKLSRLTPAQLRSKVERARKLMDKYSDQSRTQNRRSKAVGSTRENANARTAQKAQLFAEALDRFQDQLRARSD